MDRTPPTGAPGKHSVERTAERGEQAGRFLAELLRNARRRGWDEARAATAASRCRKPGARLHSMGKGLSPRVDSADAPALTRVPRPVERRPSPEERLELEPGPAAAVGAVRYDVQHVQPRAAEPGAGAVQEGASGWTQLVESAKALAEHRGRQCVSLQLQDERGRAMELRLISLGPQRVALDLRGERVDDRTRRSLRAHLQQQGFEVEELDPEDL